ncbi:DNA-binding MarR family transcriptional regulator [Stackebrandtia albiflava]|uniref:DNA-binding MarR family transcriptional regulator n=1 Tax=Stackebrandtia albiflava TaxID=406432 RepID=A0A562VDQ7_9ACTN|nr:MarR family transcriptional regulator [Stackebrandtia albiflava]TWJ15995.1 DNA-binding MarR family transcriptional regulator [Stackebrandtia albiflava]
MSTDAERDQIIERIKGAQEDMARVFAEDRTSSLLASTLTMQQLKVVVILSLDDSLSGQDLSRRLGVGLATVTGIVDRLVAQDIVRRFEDPRDRRVRRVTLTPHGRRVLEELDETGTARMQRILARLDTETLRDFESILRRILAVIDETREEQV